jgi:hypothetical protein
MPALRHPAEGIHNWLLHVEVLGFQAKIADEVSAFSHIAVRLVLCYT